MKTWTPNENITQVMLAFGPQDIEKFLPKWDLIPDEFKQGKNSWVAFIERWFYHGLECPPAAKEGVELKWALAHIMVILKSFDPKHERKIAGCAYLASLWFEG
ncbi:TPA: hypothetical protein SMO99_003025 [Proteus mirabilis]|uniref:Uncharacterized protein n=2 Tax=Morganellaceae TaxID=1903414 RepID=A0AAI9HS91_MORMO|nr:MULTISPECIES: hypothetical protein [Providencia]EJV1664344.1 hypothetical protein [Klebsiella pneumoniae]EKW7426786.1 hypothetical protein [Proteus mirabilis]EKW8761322.1 hypothetical protein [Morganella morganii]THB21816.1 hypothetical protein E6R27_19440 [Providencia sp. MGF014]ELI9034692.1 hypothetical protein [Morganella morganii]